MLQTLRIPFIACAFGALLVVALLVPAGSATPQAGRVATPVLVTNNAGQPVPVSLPQPVLTEVINPAADPVPVRDAGLLVEPVRLQFAAQAAGGNFLTTNVHTVPAGKRLIIEDLSAKATVQPLEAAEVTLRIGSFERFVPLLPAGVIVNRMKHVAGEQVRLVADEGEVIYFQCLRSGADGEHRLEAGLSGYLVEVP
jgi:hypothetical protein